MAFKVLETVPTYGSRDEVTGSYSVLAHPYVFETVALARKVAGRLADFDQNNGGDGHFIVTNTDPRKPVPVAPLNDDDMPF